MNKHARLHRESLLDVVLMLVPEATVRSALGLDEDASIDPHREWIGKHFDAIHQRASEIAVRLTPLKEGVSTREKVEWFRSKVLAVRNKAARRIGRLYPSSWVFHNYTPAKLEAISWSSDVA